LKNKSQIVTLHTGTAVHNIVSIDTKYMNYSNELRATISSRRKYLYRFGLNTLISELIGPPIGSSPIGSGHIYIYKLHYYGRCPERNNIIPRVHYNILLYYYYDYYYYAGIHTDETHTESIRLLYCLHVYIIIMYCCGTGRGGVCKIKK